MDSNGIEDILNEKDELDDILAYVDKKKNEPIHYEKPNLKSAKSRLIASKNINSNNELVYQTEKEKISSNKNNIDFTKYSYHHTDFYPQFNYNHDKKLIYSNTIKKLEKEELSQFILEQKKLVNEKNDEKTEQNPKKVKVEKKDTSKKNTKSSKEKVKVNKENIKLELTKEQVKKEKPHAEHEHSKWYFIVGVFVTLMLVIGCISFVILMIKFRSSIPKKEEILKNELMKVIYITSIADVEPYENLDTILVQDILKTSLFDIILNNSNVNQYKVENEYIIPVSEVENSAKKYFGNKILIQHGTVELGENIKFKYDSKNNSYIIPYEFNHIHDEPLIKNIVENDNKYTISVEYYKPTPFSQSKNVEYKPKIEKKYTYKVVKQDEKWIINSIIE